MDRLLMLLTAEDWPEARECLNSALTQAADPDVISVGLYLMREPDGAELEEILQDARLVMRSSGSVWQGIDDVWQGQAYVLAAHPGMRFSQRWDRSLLRAMRRCVRMSGFNTLLTGMLPRDVEPVDAVCAVGAQKIDRLDRLYLNRGTPLRYARAPVPGAFVNPDFCYAPAGFFRMMAMQDMPIFLAAGEQRWQVYTLHRPVIHLQWQEDLQPIDLRPWRDTEAMKRFETRSRFHVGERRLPPRLRTGIMTFDLNFETRVPRMVKLQEAMRTLDGYISTLKPMCVTAWLTLPGQSLDEMRMVRFRRLSGMRSLPLVCYTDPPNAAALSRSHGHVIEYQGHYGLQAPRSVIRQDLANYTRLCKPYLLARTRQRELKYTHYIWLDLDYLRYPVYERCALDWQNVCRDRIVVAMVDGKPDLSMISVPEQRLQPLCRQIDGYVQHELAQCADPAHSGLPRQENLWIRLMAQHPDWFEPVTLPGKRELLALTMLGRGEEFHTT